MSLSNPATDSLCEGRRISRSGPAGHRHAEHPAIFGTRRVRYKRVENGLAVIRFGKTREGLQDECITALVPELVFEIVMPLCKSPEDIVGRVCWGVGLFGHVI